MYQNVLSQSEQIIEIAWFLHVDTNPHKLKVDDVWAGSKSGPVTRLALSLTFKWHSIAVVLCGPPQKCPIKWGLAVLTSFHLSGYFLGIIRSIVFSEFRHGARNLYDPLYVTQPNFSEKLSSWKLGNWPKIGPKFVF